MLWPLDGVEVSGMGVSDPAVSGAISGAERSGRLDPQTAGGRIPPQVVATIATVLVHRKGFGTLWRYVADRARFTPAPLPDKSGKARKYAMPEVYVDKYAPEDHRIFFLLVLEELSNKCREAMMTNDQDIAARGGWRPPSPPPMSTVEETRDREKEIRSEARSRHQEVVGGWAPSLRRAV